MIFDEDLNESLNALKKGGVILYPTDTIWGLGCDPTNAAAVEKIFSIKSREEGKSLLILVDSETMLERYVCDVPEIAWELTSVSEDPLTIIYPAGKNLARGVCSDDGSIGIRICHDEFCHELIRRFRKPLVSTSANLSGKPSPENYDDIDQSVIEAADYVVKYRQDDRRKYSSSPVIKLGPDGTVKILRK
ncbi:MAG: threonylcarbamoyl-AMP synthase [Bacteroidales bacterium]|nr:threonylcarbamoyl-AMP synthase [Bacteroidales bacterium]MBK8881447.1 threonylcarbamoyl-AMP synthase [Bacteroidales bacterium]